MSTTASPTDTIAPAPRFDLTRDARDAYRAMVALDSVVELDATVRHLVKIRASQLNGCAYCLDMHLHDARAEGETTQRLDTLAGWHESPFFSARERAALALTDEVTQLANGHGVSDAVYDEAARHFETEELAQLVFAIAAINSWNRLAVTARSQPPTR